MVQHRHDSCRSSRSSQGESVFLLAMHASARPAVTGTRLAGCLTGQTLTRTDSCRCIGFKVGSREGTTWQMRESDKKAKSECFHGPVRSVEISIRLSKPPKIPAAAGVTPDSCQTPSHERCPVIVRNILLCINACCVASYAAFWCNVNRQRDLASLGSRLFHNCEHEGVD